MCTFRHFVCLVCPVLQYITLSQCMYYMLVSGLNKSHMRIARLIRIALPWLILALVLPLIITVLFTATQAEAG